MVLDVYLQYVISGTRQNEWSSYIHYLVWSRDSSMYYLCFNWKEPVIFMVMGPLTWAAGFSSAVSHVLENPSSFHQLCQLLLQEDQPLVYKFWHSTNTNGLHWGSCKRNHCCCCLVAKLCPTFCDPADCSPPGSSVHGILQARALEWVAISFSRGPSLLRDWTVSPTSQTDSLLLSPREGPGHKHATKPSARTQSVRADPAGFSRCLRPSPRLLHPELRAPADVLFTLRTPQRFFVSFLFF